MIDNTAATGLVRLAITGATLSMIILFWLVVSYFGLE